MGCLYDVCVYLCARKIILVCVYLVVGSEKLPALEEMDGGDKEVTEEEWIRRVAELNKHQVTVTMPLYNHLSLHVTLLYYGIFFRRD